MKLEIAKLKNYEITLYIDEETKFEEMYGLYDEYDMNAHAAAWISGKLTEVRIFFPAIKITTAFYQWDIENARGFYYEIYDDGIKEYGNSFDHPKKDRNLKFMLEDFRVKLQSYCHGKNIII